MPPQLRFIVSQRCNLSCQYCHNRQVETRRPLDSPTDSISVAVDFAALVRSRGLAVADLSLYGGEPLLNAPFVHEILGRCAELRRAGFEYSIILNTNGTRMTAQMARSLAAAEVDVHVSLDGVDESSNACRINHAGHSTLGAAKRGIALLREAGCRIQINTVLTQQNLPTLEGLVCFAGDAGCDRIFLALADTEAEPYDIDALARRLLALDGWVRPHARLFGPWRAGLGASRPLVPWPPLNIVVRPSGEVFFPHFPEQAMPSLEEAFSPEASAGLGRQWERVTEACGRCPIVESCHSYLKMMVRYHCGSAGQQETECGLARRVAELAREPDFEWLRTSVDLHVQRADDRFEISNPLLPGSRLFVSDGVLDVINAASRGANAAGLRERFEAENLDSALAELRSRRLLVAPLQDTDQLLCSRLAGAEKLLPDVNLRLGAENEGQLARWRSLEGYLRLAVARLPPRLQFHEAPFCLFGAVGRGKLASILGAAEASPELEWMAATVFHSIVVFDFECCERVIRHAGRSRIERFVQQCTHEFVHLALRQAGVRVPIWLEEGLCEFFSSAPLEAESLRYAAALAADFRGFVREASPDTNLLAFSAEPVDVNPGYHLAHDFAAFLARQQGVDCLLDSLVQSGIRSLLELGALGRSLDELLDAWVEDLARRQGARVEPSPPIRLYVHAGRAVLYNRINGGLGWFAENAPLPGPGWLGRNLSLEEAERFWGPIDLNRSQYLRWKAGLPALRRCLHLRLILDQRCNLQCTYCYGRQSRSRAMTPEVASRAIAVWRDLADPGSPARSTIRLFGGEPMLKWPVMAHVLHELEDSESPVLLNTNGTLLRAEHLDAFGALNGRVRVALSCDGLAESHDTARRDRFGRGTFERVDAAAHLLAAARIPLCINAVIGSHNYRDLPCLADYALLLRDQYRAPVSLGLELVIPPPLEPAPPQIIEACTRTVAHCLTHGLPVTGNLVYPFEGLLDAHGSGGWFCSAVGAELCVGPDGELLHCPALPLPPFSNLETVARRGEIPDPLNWRGRRAGNLPGCRGCEIEGLCGGGCAAQSYAHCGDVFGNPDPLFCALIRGVFHTCLEHLMAARACA